MNLLQIEFLLLYLLRNDFFDDFGYFLLIRNVFGDHFGDFFSKVFVVFFQIDLFYRNFSFGNFFLYLFDQLFNWYGNFYNSIHFL